MIGVIADPSQNSVVCEFFELFKTPWEFHRSERKYDVVLCCGNAAYAGSAKLVVSYASAQSAAEDIKGPARIAASKQYQIPIYCGTTSFPENDGQLLVDQSSGECLAYSYSSGDMIRAQIGYDLFNEIRTLLTIGQPVIHAATPTLELHIALLRDLIVESGVALVEIPPVPDAHPFIACLTHDVDHPSIRKHKWDHTVLGFVYRASVGSLLQAIRGGISWRGFLKNAVATLKLPFVQIGLASDFWSDFDDRYLDVENVRHSTFFVIPFSNRPGKNSQGAAPAFRGAKYGAADVASSIRKLKNSGCEIGLHGIDAWIDSDLGRVEFEEIRKLCGDSQIGVRMHWLYFDRNSPKTLETAGANYDSTVGYNETVGYRAGTAQAYKPFEVEQLIELPLQIMDTALFYPSHLGLTPAQAKVLVDRLQAEVGQFGGCLTINWHDRSTAPERLWVTTYRDLLESLTNRGAWFATASQAVAWFRKRRAVVFEGNSSDPTTLRVNVASDEQSQLPALRLRIHNPRELRGTECQNAREYVDQPLTTSVDLRICSVANC